MHGIENATYDAGEGGDAGARRGLRPARRDSGQPEHGGVRDVPHPASDANKGLLLDLSEVWHTMGDYSPALRSLSSDTKGRQIFVPTDYYALAALGALAFTWVFNDLLWSITVLRTDTEMPVTPALLGPQGQYVSDWNVIAAGSVIAAIPTVAVFLRFQRHFVAGLAVGAVK
ncbi:MAG TPA: hypothetical protein VH333_16790 [Pseudonocardiaceae bacterium]|nr:hypothetical protein [Pseudonocardiaceae bacterium]